MEHINTQFLQKHKRFRKDSKKLALLFIIAACLVALLVFWCLKLVGITATDDALCGQKEHVHTDSCFQRELVCELTETPTTTTAADNGDGETTAAVTTTTTVAPDNQSGHQHDDSCYQRILICKKTEHIHSADCFPDPEADVETVSDWLATIQDVEMSESVSQNLVAIATSQMGYTESDRNFEYDDNGIKRGYTRYGEWYGTPYGKWDATFVSFCLHYSGAINASRLKSAGAESMRQIWKRRAVYTEDKNYQPQPGDLVFLDTDHSGTADTVAILLAYHDTNLTVVMGDSNDAVETTQVKTADAVGYGTTGLLAYSADVEQEETGSSIPEGDTITQLPLRSMVESPLATFNLKRNNIEYYTDLSKLLISASFSDKNGNPIGPNDTVHLGDPYVVSLRFKEHNQGNVWKQLSSEGQLVYRIPSNLKCDPSPDWQPISAETEDGMEADVGRYRVYEDGRLVVEFFDSPNSGENFVDLFTNVAFNIDFNAKVIESEDGTNGSVNFNEEIKVDLKVDDQATMTVDKIGGNYDPDDHTVGYAIKVTADSGIIRDLILDDSIFADHTILRNTVVATYEDGTLLDPQPTVGDPIRNPNDRGCSIQGFPDLTAGESIIVTYRAKLDDYLLDQDEVGLWNGVDASATSTANPPPYSYDQEWNVVKLDKMNKNGKQVSLEGPDGELFGAIEWTVDIRKSHLDLHGTVVFDKLGDGLSYYTGKPIKIVRYNRNGARLPDVELNWDDVVIRDGQLEIILPEGYEFQLTYYTTYEEVEEGKDKEFNNEVHATINGEYAGSKGEANVVGFVPRVKKTARGDGAYIYYTIETDVPSFVKDWNNFYLTDMAYMWGHSGINGSLFVDNKPENMVITATNAAGDTITFTPYINGESAEHTFILMAPGVEGYNHSFNILFNTSELTLDASKWIEDEDYTLTVTYRLPFDTETGTNDTGELNGDQTVGDILQLGTQLANTVYVTFKPGFTIEATSPFEYDAKITKDAVIQRDGTIDYTVVFNNSVPGTNNSDGFLNYFTTSAFFHDTFDPRMEYVVDSLTVTTHDPWDSTTWLNRYTYHGQADGNTLKVSATDFIWSESSPDISRYEWYELDKQRTLDDYYRKLPHGGNFIFTYTLKLKDEYFYTTDDNVLELSNTAEVTWDTNGTSGTVTEVTQYETGLIDKTMAQEDDRLDFAIYVNRNSLDVVEGQDTLTVTDTMTSNLAVYWDTIQLYYEDGIDNWVNFKDPNSQYTSTTLFDQYTNTLTFIIPDELHVKIDYSTLVNETGLVSVHNVASIEGKAEVSDFVDAIFRVQNHSGSASGSIHNITLIKHDGFTGMPLPGVEFHLYGPVGDPKAPHHDGLEYELNIDGYPTLYYIGDWTTGADGSVHIKTQYLAEGNLYALVEHDTVAGYTKLDKPVYFYFYANDPNGVIQTVTTIVTVENFTYGFVLPETGGIGTYPFVIIGLCLMALPILNRMFRHKRERRLT